jgi:hypothetical protein
MKGSITSRFFETTFLTTAGKSPEASFPLATICKKKKKLKKSFFKTNVKEFNLWLNGQYID